MLYRDFTTLLDVTDGGTDPIVGDTIALNPLPVDGVADHEQAVLVLATGAWTGANGTIQVILETSADAENWFPVWTGSPGENPFKLVNYPQINDMGGGNQTPAVMRYVRARSEPQGMEAPTVDRLKVQLGSTGPLRGRKAR